MKINNLSWKYWLIPIFLTICQLVWTLNSTSQLRYEEVAESIRNVFWLQNRTIYDGISSNVGWYGTLLVIYKIFGFSLFTAKYYRLFLFVISIFCLASLLRKYLGDKKALIPLLIIGLSPTLLYFNTLQTSYGIDLEYLPIVIFLLDKTTLYYSLINYFFQGLAWMIAMIAAMSYPSFIYYIPGLFFFYYWKDLKSEISLSKKVLIFIISLSCFLIPFIFAITYIQDKQLLFYDAKQNSGIFRGAGSLVLNNEIWTKNLAGLSSDLFYKGQSYNFDLTKTDFSDYYPIITLILVLILSFWLIMKRNKTSTLLLFIWTTFIASFILSTISFDPTGLPGIRRYTAILAAYYLLLIFVWYHCTTRWKSDEKKVIVLILFSLLLTHHLIVLPINISTISQPSRFAETWLSRSDVTPEKYLTNLVNEVQQSKLELSCINDKNEKLTCRYSEIYATVGGSCLWNNIKCKDIVGFDKRKDEYIPLSIDLWEKYYWSH